uniref:Exostosin GT47 domain-containing protein n=1 Tax=viral metagenome TaxID=1070528 RepID=A0A6C0IEG2_9ZZZZ
MYATHHKTGRQVRILTHTTSTWKSKKTLVWLNASSNQNVFWKKYDIGVVGSEIYDACISKNIIPDILVCVEKNDVEWIRKNYKKVKMIFASNDILDMLTTTFFEENKVQNIISLEELHHLYTFLDLSWNGSINDACLLVALTLRFSVTFPLEKNNRKLYSLKVKDTIEEPQELWFITQHYKPKQSLRSKELNECIERNLKNPYIDKIVLLNETEIFYENDHNKIHQVVINKRLYYSDVFQYIYDKVPENVIVVFANSDIYLDETIRNIWSVNIEDKFFALLRYENNEIYGPRPDSQDTWIISSSSVKARSNNYKDIDFSFGIMGCDNAITLEMMRQKYLVVNPSLTIKTHHLHKSEIRNYDPEDIVPKSAYLYVEPTGLHDMEAVTHIQHPIIKKLTFESFDRPIQCSNVRKAETFCSMVKDFEFSSKEKNTVGELTQPIYKLNNIFVTNTGLTYDYDKIYVGKSKVATEAWAQSDISTLTPSVSSEISYVAYIPDSYVENVENYLLYYLSKILLMKTVIQKNGEFWCPNESSFINVLRLFKWNQKQMPLLSRNESQLAFVNEAYVWLPSDDNNVTKEQMAALRAYIQQYDDGNDDNDSICIFMDSKYVTSEFVKMLEAIYPNVSRIYNTTPIEQKIAYLQNASLTILSSSSIQSYGWLWCMKPGTKVYDIKNEMSVKGDVIHIANACQLDYHFMLVPKDGMKNEKILSDIQGLKGKDFQKPVIFVPVSNHKERFFHHAGDSFREIIDLWEERGYIEKQYSSCKNVWLHSIGDTLLYDRPNYDWIKESDGEEQMWKKGLFGNPKPLGGKSVPWSFWPRRPRLVEAMLNNTFEKTKGVVFYGCTENQIQKMNRTKYDWSKCCDEFVMSEEPKFSQQEYLDNLSKAKYGLCLAGYGKKCHREVECMAFGCIPLVSNEVDMDSYANPPMVGVHYLRVSSPEDLVNKVKANKNWLEMSEACKVWYKENCSVDGMWLLTKKLCSL